jgi:pimeloyl-ACP methyl ester carboxylesterase
MHAEYADIPLYVAGAGPGAVLAAYAALLEPDIAGVIAVNPPQSHMEADAPQFLNVLRVCDIPDAFGMLAPRPLTLYGWSGEALKKVSQIYASADAADKLLANSDTGSPQ